MSLFTKVEIFSVTQGADSRVAVQASSESDMDRLRELIESSVRTRCQSDNGGKSVPPYSSESAWNISMPGHIWTMAGMDLVSDIAYDDLEKAATTVDSTAARNIAFFSG